MSKFNLQSFGCVCCQLSLLTLLIQTSIQQPAGAQTSPKHEEIAVEAMPENESVNQNLPTLEQSILAEINRVRTDPQGYAAWLETQKQYYDGIKLQLPGERPIRTNKGLQALEEAIAFLETQASLTPLTADTNLVTKAAEELQVIAAGRTQANIHLNNISYGRVTAAGIVMQLVVDNPSLYRNYQTNLFEPSVQSTGVICQPDRRYENICAIAYEQQSEIAKAESPTGQQIPAKEAAELPAVVEAETLPKPSVPHTTEQETTNSPSVVVETETTTKEDKPVTIEVPAVDSLPSRTTQPPLPNAQESDRVTVTESSSNITSQEETDVVEIPVTAANSSQTEDSESIDLEVETQESASQQVEIATSNNPQIVETIKRGILESGDQVIPDDGSFYDSYPLEVKAGDRFIISLESSDFDTFLAIMDSNGNILEQNDDISEENSNSRLRITIPQDGVYNLIVNAYNEGGKGNYILTVRR